MADTKISALTAASALAAADIAPVVQGGANVKATVQQLVTAATGSTAFPGETLTTSKPAVDLAQTWNASGTTFTGMKFNATDTASAAGSLLMDLQVGGASRFSVGKSYTGLLFLTGNDVNHRTSVGGGFRVTSADGGSVRAEITNTRIGIVSNGQISFANNASSVLNGYDTSILRDEAGAIAQRNGTNAQTFRLYNTFTDASNYERGFMRWNSNVLEIGSEAAGTGTLRNVRLRAAGSAGDNSYFEASWNAGLSVTWNAGSNYSNTKWLNGNIQFSVGTVTNFLGINTSGSNRLTLADTVNIEVGTTTGTKIGTATSQKLSFYNSTPVIQPAAVADATDVTDVVAQLNTLLARVRTLGLIAT